MAAAIPVIVAIASIASTAYSVYSAVTSKGGDSKPTIVQAPKTGVVDEAAAAEAKRIKQKRAAASTISTSPEGVMTAPVVGKEKLGE